MLGFPMFPPASPVQSVLESAKSVIHPCLLYFHRAERSIGEKRVACHASIPSPPKQNANRVPMLLASIFRPGMPVNRQGWGLDRHSVSYCYYIAPPTFPASWARAFR